MSMSKYFKNYILFGDVESHCLLCKETFQCRSLVEKHIRWEKHRNSVKAQTYIPKLKKDFISKVDSNYYCDICNYCTKDFNILTEHINSEVHKTNKEDPEKVNKICIGKHELGSVFVQNKVITNTQWNGIFGERCVICSNNVGDIATHVKSQDHIVNLIQTETKCENDQYYRKLNGHCFQCFTCKNIFSDNNFNDHWTSDIHIENVNKIKISLKAPKHSIDMDNLVSEAQNILLETQRDYFKLDIEKETSICKTCNDTVSLDLKEMLLHLKERHTDLLVKELLAFEKASKNKQIRSDSFYIDHGRVRSDLAIYGKDHYIKLNEGGRKAYCWLCDVSLIPVKKIFREHIKGLCHKSHLQLKYTEIYDEHEVHYKTTTLNRFIRNINYSTDLKSFLINTEYCVDNLSFFFLLKIDYNPRKIQIKCHVCNTIFLPQGMLKHCKTRQHAEYVMSSKFLDMKDEFIREIQPRKYHCGYCNQVFSLSITLEKHLKSYKHFVIKTDHTTIMCFEVFHKTKGWTPAVEQISLSSNMENMYLNYLKLAFSAPFYNS